MDIQELLATAKTQTFDLFERQLNTLIREDYHYRNMDEGNKRIVLGLVKKYLPKIRNGLGVSALNVRDEMHKLYENRVKFNLTEEDLKDIREILELFKK